MEEMIPGPKAVEPCPRCGGRHEGLQWRRFTKAQQDASGTYERFAMCPELQEPILLAVLPPGTNNPVALKRLETAEEHAAALEEVKAWMLEGSLSGRPTTNSVRLELLAILVQEYEARTVNIPLPSALEAIKFRMDQMGYTRKDLVELLGPYAAGRILNGAMELTLNHVRKLYGQWGVSAAALLMGAGILTERKKIVAERKARLKKKAGARWMDLKAEREAGE